MVTRIRITRPADPRELADLIAPKMDNLGRAVGVRMQRLVPKRTWALHDTIVARPAEVAGGHVSVEIAFGGGGVDYGLFVERGTSRMRAQPFARPALSQSRSADLNYGGPAPVTHGVVGTRRTRARGRRGAS